MNKVSIVSILLVAAMTAPTAAATWRSFGNQEPDSHWDQAGYTWFDPPTPGAGNQIYFNAFQTNTLVAQDSSTTGSRIDNYGLFTFSALLGYWADCNQDGYIGQAETAMLEYPDTVLTALAAAGTAIPPECVAGGAHNHGGWVSEMLPIAANGNVKGKTPSQYDPRVIEDDSAAVWGDLGLVTAAVRGSCAVTPMEPRALHSTGGVLDYADCIGAGAIANNFNTVAGASGGNVAPVANPGSKHAWLNSPYNKDTFGEDDAENSFVGLSCSGAPLWSPVGGQMNTAYGTLPGTATANLDGEWGQQPASGHPDFTQQGPHVPTVGAPNTNGDAPGTVNASYEVLTGDCNTHNDQGNDFYSCMTHQVSGNHPCEGQNVGTDATAKTAADFLFQFSADHRGAPPTDPAGGPTNSGVAQVDNAPEDFGIPVVSAIACTEDCATDTGGLVIQDHQNQWVSQVAFVSDPRVFNGPRTSPAVGQFRDASFYTFYARFGVSGVLPPGASSTHVYGSERCPQIGAGVASPNGWVCDPNAWNLDATGQPLNQRFTFGTVGFQYTLRDVDCNDGTIARTDDGTPTGAAVPVYAGTGGLAAINCDNSAPS